MESLFKSTNQCLLQNPVRSYFFAKWDPVFTRRRRSPCLSSLIWTRHSGLADTLPPMRAPFQPTCDSSASILMQRRQCLSLSGKISKAPAKSPRDTLGKIHADPRISTRLSPRQATPLGENPPRWQVAFFTERPRRNARTFPLSTGGQFAYYPSGTPTLLGFPALLGGNGDACDSAGRCPVSQPPAIPSYTCARPLTGDQ